MDEPRATPKPVLKFRILKIELADPSRTFQDEDVIVTFRPESEVTRKFLTADEGLGRELCLRFTQKSIDAFNIKPGKWFRFEEF